MKTISAFLLRIRRGLETRKTAVAALPALLAVVFCYLNVWLSFRSGAVEINYARLNYGSSLLAGLPGRDLTWAMPLFETALSFALNLGANYLLLLILTHLACYALVFCAGCLLRGYWAGIAALAGAGLFETAAKFTFDDEQSFYSFFVLLTFSLLLIKRRENTVKNGILCGLALGASMLVRTPLLLFPPALVLLDWFYTRERSRAFFLRSLALLAASYVLLVPWGILNRSVSGRFTILDGGRGACNLITGALGSVYTMEGNCRELASLAPGDSAFGFFARETATHPGLAAVNAAKRLWHIFLFYPLLFGLFIVALALNRERDKLFIFSLPAYFLLIHSALSIENRYFYPLLYILPPLMAGSFPRRGAGAPEPRCAAAEKTVAALFLISLCAVLGVEALIAAYPHRAAANGMDQGYAARIPGIFPEDKVFQRMKCEQLWIKGDDEGYYKCLAPYYKKFHDKAGAYFLEVRSSALPSALPVPIGMKVDCYIIRMLREFELGDKKAALASLMEAYSGYEAWHNMLRGEPYRRDKELALRIKAGSDAFWDEKVYPLVLMFPPRNIAAILSGLQKEIVLPKRSKLKTLCEVLALGEPGERMVRKRVATDSSGLTSGTRSLLWKEAAGRSKALSDSAVKKMIAGDFREAERILSKTAELDPANPEVFMNLCFIGLKEKDTEKALNACQSAAYAVYFNPENQLPALEILAAEASFRSYKLLKGAGRKLEAVNALRRAVENAPDGWPGLPEARKALNAQPQSGL